MPRAAALELAARGARFLVKAGDATLRFGAGHPPLSRGDAERYLVHEDGFLRVPVLVLGDLVVRGYTEELYREVLTQWTQEGARK